MDKKILVSFAVGCVSGALLHKLYLFGKAYYEKEVAEPFDDNPGVDGEETDSNDTSSDSDVELEIEFPEYDYSKDPSEYMIERELANVDYRDTEYYNEDEEEHDLKYDPNSDEALEQWVSIKTANVMKVSNVRILYRLFEHEWIIPEECHEADSILMDNLVEERLEFFGPESKWINQVTIAEVILHLAGLLEFDLGEDIPVDWLEFMFENLLLYPNIDDEDLMELLNDLTNHQYYVDGDNYGHGVFRLKEPEMGFMDGYYRFVDNVLSKNMTFKFKGVDW